MHLAAASGVPLWRFPTIPHPVASIVSFQRFGLRHSTRDPAALQPLMPCVDGCSVLDVPIYQAILPSQVIEATQQCLKNEPNSAMTLRREWRIQSFFGALGADRPRKSALLIATRRDRVEWLPGWRSPA